MEEWCHWIKLPSLVLTDHKNLKYIYPARGINSRQARCSLLLALLSVFKVERAPAPTPPSLLHVW